MSCLDWFRRPVWAADWGAWREATREVAALSGETLPWPYEPEPPSAFWKRVDMAMAITVAKDTSVGEGP